MLGVPQEAGVRYHDSGNGPQPPDDLPGVVEPIQFQSCTLKLRLPDMGMAPVGRLSSTHARGLVDAATSTVPAAALNISNAPMSKLLPRLAPV